MTALSERNAGTIKEILSDLAELMKQDERMPEEQEAGSDGLVTEIEDQGTDRT